MNREDLKELRQIWRNSSAFRQLCELGLTQTQYTALCEQYAQRGLNLNYIYRHPNQWGDKSYWRVQRVHAAFSNGTGCSITTLTVTHLGALLDVDKIEADFRQQIPPDKYGEYCNLSQSR